MDVSISLAEPSPKHRVALIKADYGQCRFIVGEPGARVMCCGASTQRGSNWCAWHRGIVYVRQREQPLEVRRRISSLRSAMLP